MADHRIASTPPRWARWVAAAAPVVRSTARRGVDFATLTVRTAPGALGAAAISYGAGLVYHPLLFLVAGAFLMLLDRRIP